MGDIHDPVRRQRYRFSHDGPDLRADVDTDPGGDVPEHEHPAQTEWWEVISGAVMFTIDGEQRRVGPGDHLRADPGVRHAFVNDGNSIASLRVRVSPAGTLEAFLTEAARLARAGAFDSRGIPSSPKAVLELLRLVLRYRHDIMVTSPPAARALSAVLKRLP